MVNQSKKSGRVYSSRHVYSAKYGIPNVCPLSALRLIYMLACLQVVKLYPINTLSVLFLAVMANSVQQNH